MSSDKTKDTRTMYGGAARGGRNVFRAQQGMITTPPFRDYRGMAKPDFMSSTEWELHKVFQSEFNNPKFGKE